VTADLDPASRELLLAIAAALDLGDRPADPAAARVWNDRLHDRAVTVATVCRTLLEHGYDQGGRAHRFARELRAIVAEQRPADQ
jgi:hypothetical protein